MTRLLALILLCTALASCTTVGNGRVRELQPAEAHQLLQPGRTTRAEAERLLGAGSVLRLDSGWTTSHYVYRDGLPRFLDFLPVVGHRDAGDRAGAAVRPRRRAAQVQAQARRHGLSDSAAVRQMAA